jgi:oligopeptide/dipeptide ABC transporter ATP-binding protein
MKSTGEPILAVEDLRVSLPTERGMLRAVDGVSFSLFPGEVLGIVGESGCGKTMAALSLLRLQPQHADVKGAVRYRGDNLLEVPMRRLRQVRGDRIAMVFQDALASLNPLRTVGSQIDEAIAIHHPRVRRRVRSERVRSLLAEVGLSGPARARQYPHELSGGMRQRVMIAMAIANDPDIVIADEPTTALDVTTQAQVLEVLKAVQTRTQAALVLISHDLGVVAGMADRLIVMYAGKVVEVGSAGSVLGRPEHPYTRGLLESIPRLEEQRRRLRRIPGQPPSLVDVPPGCAFHPRCPYAQLPRPCAAAVPSLLPVIPADEHLAACHFVGSLAEAAEVFAGGT